MKPSVDDLVGRTIKDYVGNWWKVSGFNGEHIFLSTPSGHAQGRMHLNSLKRCHLYPTHEEIEKRYPRLIRALKWVTISPHGEVVSTLVGHIVDGPFSKSSETVAQFGGSAAVIRQAIRCRHCVRKMVSCSQSLS